MNSEEQQIFFFTNPTNQQAGKKKKIWKKRTKQNKSHFSHQYVWINHHRLVTGPTHLTLASIDNTRPGSSVNNQVLMFQHGLFFSAFAL